MTTVDGGFTATCEVTVEPPKINGHAYVEMGVTSADGKVLKWATMNVGATSETGGGDYFAWGEVEPYYSRRNPLTWKEEKDSGYAWSTLF